MIDFSVWLVCLYSTREATVFILYEVNLNFSFQIFFFRWYVSLRRILFVWLVFCLVFNDFCMYVFACVYSFFWNIPCPVMLAYRTYLFIAKRNQSVKNSGNIQKISLGVLRVMSSILFSIIIFGARLWSCPVTWHNVYC